jgi:hypothetical protein
VSAGGRQEGLTPGSPAEHRSPLTQEPPVTQEPVTHEAQVQATVEGVVRAQLAKALGGRRGVLESAVPTVAFTLTYLTLDALRPALIVAVGSAVLLVVVRLLQRSTVQFVLNSLVGIGIAAVFALRSGQAEDVFLPGILYNAAYSVVMVLSIVIRWPLLGFLLGSVTGEPTAWRSDPAIVRLCQKLTWILVLPCLVRVAVQLPLYLGGLVGLLGASKVLLGWPLQIAALAGMAWLLARGRTPIAAGAQPVPPGSPSG